MGPGRTAKCGLRRGYDGTRRLVVPFFNAELRPTSRSAVLADHVGIRRVRGQRFSARFRSAVLAVGTVLLPTDRPPAVPCRLGCGRP